MARAFPVVRAGLLAIRLTAAVVLSKIDTGADHQLHHAGGVPRQSTPVTHLESSDTAGRETRF